ncbi:carboxymuconolactone decarboxylase family protein [Novosphingobium sp. ZW T3_23]|uniref:carboxymuconolactone decarboxylase family protein n=1 Tax=Novosphingobium sp. ZW T3_23 TaxID=3378084 RepID=UPI003853216F
MVIGNRPRVAPLAKEAWTDEARDVFAYWEGESARSEGSRSNTMMTLANHPQLAIASLDLGRYFMLESGLGARELKLLILRVAHRYESHYQWAHNSLGAKQLGVSDAEIEAIRVGPGDPIWNARDRLLITAIDEIGNGGKVSDETWAGLTAAMDLRTVMDLVHAVGYFTMVAWGLVAMGVEVEPDFAQFSQNRAKAG